MKWAVAGLIAVAAMVGLAAYGHDSAKAVRGVYATANRPFNVDPDPKDTRRRIYLELHGDVAKEMYLAMKGRIHKNTCGMSSVKLKQTKDVVCMLNKADYECVFVINAESGELEKGFSC